MNKLTACLSGIALVLISAGAQSQETSGLQLEEVVVTATKRDTDLQKTSISIQTYSGEQLKQEGKKRIDDIMAGVVGVQVQGGIVGSQFYMRGVESGTQGANSQATVAVLIDGVYQNRAEVVRGGSLDVSQVEVSRGTQSSNLGASAIAGAISIVSNQPAFEYAANGSLEVGNYDLINLEGVLNVPVTDNQAFRVAYSSSKRDGFYKSGVGDNDLQNVRLKYRWQATDTLNAVLTASLNKIGGNGAETGALLKRGKWEPWSGQVTLGTAVGSCSPMGAATQLTYGCPPLYYANIATGEYYFERSNPWDDGHPGVWPNNPYRHTDIANVSAEVTWQTGIGTLKLTPSMQRTTFKSVETPFNNNSWGAEDRLQKTRSFEAQLSSPSGSAFDWTAGLYYYSTDQTGTFLTQVVPGTTAAANPCAGTNWCYYWSRDNETSQETQSAYANGSVPVADTLRLIGGVRYAKDEKAYINSLNAAGTAVGTVTGTAYGPNTAFNFTCLAIAATNCGKASWKGTTYSAGVEYDVLPESMLYAKYSTGYQPGGVTAMGGRTEKLTLEQITLGMKNRFFDNKLQFNVEAFGTTYHNRPVQGGISAVQLSDTTQTQCTLPATGTYYVEVGTPAGSGCLAYLGAATAPDVISKGVDVELNFLPTTSDRIDLSVEYLNSSYKSVPQLAQGVAYPTVASIQAANAAVTATQAQILLDKFNALLTGYNGAILQNSAKYSGSFSYSHRFSFASGSSLTPRISASYKSKYWTLNGPNANIGLANQALNYGSGRYYANGTYADGIQPGYSLFDAFTTWQSADGKFSVSAYMKNIENKAVLAGASVRQVYLLPPRTFGATFSANF